MDRLVQFVVAKMEGLKNRLVFACPVLRTDAMDRRRDQLAGREMLVKKIITVDHVISHNHN